MNSPITTKKVARSVMTAGFVTMAATLVSAEPTAIAPIELAKRAADPNVSPEELKKREPKKQQSQERRELRKEQRGERKEQRQQRKIEHIQPRVAPAKPAPQRVAPTAPDSIAPNAPKSAQPRHLPKDQKPNQRIAPEAVPPRNATPAQAKQRQQNAPALEGRGGALKKADPKPKAPANAAAPQTERRERDLKSSPDRANDNARDVQRNRNADGDRRRWRREQREAERKGGFSNMEALKKSRKERRLAGGRAIIEEPDARRIIRSGDRSFIIRDETRRLRRFGSVADQRQRPGGGNITTIVRPNGARIITETAPDGRLIRRYRRTRNGGIVNLVDNRRTWRKWGAIGAGAAIATGLLLALDPPRYRMPRDRYIVEYDHASYDDIYDALAAPPIDDVGPGYTLDHVLFNYNLRARMRRVDLNSINFDFGAWDIEESQYGKLESLARAIKRILDRDPDEVFLIEGHTDAVGDPVSNRSLSDRRAEEVATILTEEFGVPPENLVIQGYGEEFLKVDTQEASRANRRVTVRRITPLLDHHEARTRD